MPKLKFIFVLCRGIYFWQLLRDDPARASTDLGARFRQRRGCEIRSGANGRNAADARRKSSNGERADIFVPDAKFKDFPTGQSAYEMSVRAGKGEKGGKNSDKRALRICLDEHGGIHARLSKNVLERYAGAAKQGEAPTLKAAIKFENDTKAVYELVVGNEFKASDEAQTGGVYILEPGQVTGVLWTDSTTVHEALLGKTVKIGALRKGAK